MKLYQLIIVALLSLLMACQSGEKSNTASGDSTATSTKKKGNAIAGVGACSLLSEETLQAILPSEKGHMIDEENDEEGKRIACKLAAKDGSGLMAWAINYNKRGWKSNEGRFSKLDVYAPVEIAGADGAYIHTAQGRMEIWKGKYSITLTPPRIISEGNNTEKLKSRGIKVAEELLKKL